MPGKKGMRWGKNKQMHSMTIEQAIAQTEERLPELFSILLDIATDKSIPNKDKIDSIKLITDRILAKQNREKSGRGIVFTADDFVLMSRQQCKAVQTEEFQKTWTPEIKQAYQDKPMIEVFPDKYDVFDIEGKVIKEGS
jgi:hypothetical protein